MNLFAPGLREASRMLGRQVSRARLFVARRRLAQAETELGVLGWQQAHFESDARQYVDQLTDFERAQARLTNVSATQALAIIELQEERARERRQFDEAHALLEAERANAAGSVEEAERQFAARQRMLENTAERLAVLEREQRDVLQLHRERLSVEPRTAEVRLELSRLSGRLAAIPDETANLRKRQQQAAQETPAIEETLQLARAVLAEVDERRRGQQEEFAQADAAREKEIADREHEKRAADKGSESLEKAKGSPHRKLGQFLADQGIAPMNQPQALAAVEQARAEVTPLDAAIAKSLRATRRENRAILQQSWWLLAAVVFAVLLIALALWH